MSSYITISHIKVQSANCVAGITYGFPAVSSFLGFVHALSRKLIKTHHVSLKGCGIISHETQVLIYKTDKFSDYYFTQTKNPSAFQYQQNKIGGTPPIIEEGKMHLTVSLVVECNGFNGTDVAKKELENHIKKLCLTHRLSGGIITNIQDVIYENISNNTSFYRLQRRLLPGAILMNRSHYLNEHCLGLQQLDSESQMIDAWLDFCALKLKAQPLLKNDEKPTSDTSAEWTFEPKPNKGYLVPLMVGYQAISKPHKKGVVENARDPRYPFCFTEAIYSVGEWLSPHRMDNLTNILWNYHHENEKYLCTQELNNIAVIENDSDDIDDIFFND